jgi:hypothetical protein
MRRPWQPAPVRGFGRRGHVLHEGAATRTNACHVPSTFVDLRPCPTTALPVVQIEGSKFKSLNSANYVLNSRTAPAPPRNPGSIGYRQGCAAGLGGVA